MKNSIKLVLLFLVTTAMTACSGPRTHLAQPDLGENLGKVKKVGVLVASCNVNVIELGGVTKHDQDASAQAKPIFEQGIIGGLKSSGYEAKLISDKSDIIAIKKGWVPIAKEMKSHFPNPPTPATVESSIIGFDDVRKKYDVDCVVIAEGVENVSSAARKSALVLGALVGVSGGKGISHFVYELFCANGRPMYFDIKSATDFSLSNHDDIENITGQLVEKMKLATVKK
jgi:hypothetical protein